MKKLIVKLLVGLSLAMSLAGCGTVVHESAMDWLAKQPSDGQSDE